MLLDADESGDAHHYVAAGIYSFTASPGCGIDTLGVFTNVSHYKDWIQSAFPAVKYEKVQSCDRAQHIYGSNMNEVNQADDQCEFSLESMQQMRFVSSAFPSLDR